MIYRWSYEYFSSLPMSRIQPLNGKISSVTQVHSERGTSRPGYSAADIHPVIKEPSTFCVTSLQKCDNTVPSKAGMFAGIGEFPLTSKEETTPTTQLPLQYREDAMLRYDTGTL